MKNVDKDFEANGGKKVHYVHCFIHILLLFSHQVLSDSFATPWTEPHQAPLSMGFFRQEYCSGLQFPPPGDLLNSGM